MRRFLILASAAFALAAGAAQATTVVGDAKGDLGQALRPDGAPTAAADAILHDYLDLTSFSAAFDGEDFLLSATVADTIDLASDARFVIGIDTGVRTQSAAFPTDFFFDKTITISLNGPSTSTPGVGFSDLKFDGNRFSVAVSLASLHAFKPDLAARDFGFNVWSQAVRTTRGANGAIQRTNVDFAPEHGAIAAVPEPATWAIMVGGFGLMGGALRQRRTLRTAAIRA
jgi:hypothetical protein